MLATYLSLKSMETNRVAPEWGRNPFWSDSIDFNESYVASVIAAFVVKRKLRDCIHFEIFES